MRNVAKVAKPPRIDQDEIVPFTMDEARRIMSAAQNVRNGARFVVALTLGLRRGEALGLKWSDLDIQWRHGCVQDGTCRGSAARLCSQRRLTSATMTIRRAVQQFVWRHGCPDTEPCGLKYGAHCPQLHGGGVVITDVKSRAGRRAVGMPAPLVQAIERHRERQTRECAHAGQPVARGRLGVHQPARRAGPPQRRSRELKALLRKAEVRNARLHDARHTAATMLLVLQVPLPAVMQILGWSDASMAKRYMHVPGEFLAAIANQVVGLVWAAPEDEDDDPARRGAGACLNGGYCNPDCTKRRNAGRPMITA
jgi:integrase